MRESRKSISVMRVLCALHGERENQAGRKLNRGGAKGKGAEAEPYLALSVKRWASPSTQCSTVSTSTSRASAQMEANKVGYRGKLDNQVHACRRGKKRIGGGGGIVRAAPAKSLLLAPDLMKLTAILQNSVIMLTFVVLRNSRSSLCLSSNTSSIFHPSLVYRLNVRALFLGQARILSSLY